MSSQDKFLEMLDESISVVKSREDAQLLRRIEEENDFLQSEAELIRDYGDEWVSV